MINSLALALAPVVIILALSELLWRRKVIKGEKARKFIHILAGAWMAFWPLYLPFDGIFILGCLALTILLYSRYTRLFHAIYSVKRRTYGELCLALAIMVCAFLAREPWIFVVAILLVALADGIAAVAGRYLGIKNQYFVLKKKYLRKSVAGTVTFLLFTYISIGIGLLISEHDFVLNSIDLAGSAVLLFVLPIGATIIENITPYGVDNILLPVFATILLNSLL